MLYSTSQCPFFFMHSPECTLHYVIGNFHVIVYKKGLVEDEKKNDRGMCSRCMQAHISFTFSTELLSAPHSHAYRYATARDGVILAYTLRLTVVVLCRRNCPSF